MHNKAAARSGDFAKPRLLKLSKKGKTALRLIATARFGAFSQRIRDYVRRWHSQYQDGERGLWRAKLVAWQDNRVRLDGCTFSVDNPAVSAVAKATLWSGTYEASERKALDYIDPTLPVVELGGNIGVVACLADKRLRPGTLHVVVEPNAAILPTLFKNRGQNGCSFHVLPKAIGYGVKEVRFIQLPDSLGSRIGDWGDSVAVPAVSLREILSDFGIEDFTLICDIEGAEESLLLNEADLIKRHARTIIMEVHPQECFLGQKRADQLIASIHELGFRTQWTAGVGNVYCWCREPIRPRA
jgi:FkbM family methyltransferase